MVCFNTIKEGTRGRLAHKGCRAAAFPEKKMKYLNNSFLQNIPTISIFFKKYELDNFKLKYSRRILSAAENRTAGGRCPNQTLGGGVGTDRASGGTDSDLGRWPRCPECFKENFIWVYLL